jgi:hypothetical protein
MGIGLALSVLGLAVAGSSVPSAMATMFRDYRGEISRRDVYAAWSSCYVAAPGDPCAYFEVGGREGFDLPETDANGKQDCVSVGVARGVAGYLGEDHPTFLEPYDVIVGYACDVAKVNVAASLTHGEVQGELPARECHYAPGVLATCVSTTVSVALEWRSSGDVMRQPGVIYHHSDYAPDERCLWHSLPSSIANATVSGQIDGAAPAGDLVYAVMATGGVIEHGTMSFCFD